MSGLVFQLAASEEPKPTHAHTEEQCRANGRTPYPDLTSHLQAWLAGCSSTAGPSLRRVAPPSPIVCSNDSPPYPTPRAVAPPHIKP